MTNEEILNKGNDESLNVDVILNNGKYFRGCIFSFEDGELELELESEYNFKIKKIFIEDIKSVEIC